MGTNLFFSVLIFVFGLSGVYLLPASLDDVSAGTDGSEEKGQRDILYSSFFKNKWSLMALLAKGVGYMSFSFLEPILSVHIKSLGWDANDTGFAFTLLTAMWGVGSPIMGLLCQYVNRRIVVCLSFLVAWVSLLLVGAPKVVGFPASTGTLLVGLGLLGFSVSGCVIAVMPEIVDAINEEERKKDGAEAK